MTHPPIAGKNFRLRKHYKMKPQMNTDEHSAAQPQPKKNLTTKTRRNPLQFFASSCLRGEHRMRALPGERTKIPCKKQRIFGLVVIVQIPFARLAPSR